MISGTCTGAHPRDYLFFRAENLHEAIELYNVYSSKFIDGLNMDIVTPGFPKEFELRIYFGPSRSPHIDAKTRSDIDSTA